MSNNLDDATDQGLRSILGAGTPIQEAETPDYPPDASTVKVPAEEPTPTMSKPAGSLGVPDETFSDIELDDNQNTALATFKEAAGSGWQKKLKQCWTDGQYKPEYEIDENTRIALEQVKHLVGEDSPPAEVAGDVTGRTKLKIKTEAKKIKTEAKKGKFPWEEIGQKLLGMINEPTVQEEIASIAGINFTEDPESWAAFWAELAGKFKSIGFLAKAKKSAKDKPPKDDKPDDDDEGDDDEIDLELDMSGDDLGGGGIDFTGGKGGGGGGGAPSFSPGAAPSPSAPPMETRQFEATEDAIKLAVAGDLDGALRSMLEQD